MYTIGEFSRMTQLTVKTLRFYHEQGILNPDQISYENNYRLYGNDSFERAIRITQLKAAGFSINEIKSIFNECREEKDILDFLRKKRNETKDKINSYREIESRLEQWENNLRSEEMKEDFEIKEWEREEILIAAVKIKGEYSQVGKGFGLLYKKAGRWLDGKAFALYHDLEYKEKDANFEAGFKIKKKIEADGVDCRNLPGQKIVSLIHKGAYGTQGDSYARLFAYCQEKGLTPESPLMEIYHKGPGMLFKGNPEKYLTEIQIPVK